MPLQRYAGHPIHNPAKIRLRRVATQFFADSSNITIIGDVGRKQLDSPPFFEEIVNDSEDDHEGTIR